MLKKLKLKFFSGKGTEKARQLGKEGEDLAGITQQKERIPSLTNSKKYRVPDECMMKKSYGKLKMLVVKAIPNN